MRRKQPKNICKGHGHRQQCSHGQRKGGVGSGWRGAKGGMRNTCNNVNNKKKISFFNWIFLETVIFWGRASERTPLHSITALCHYLVINLKGQCWGILAPIIGSFIQISTPFLVIFSQMVCWLLAPSNDHWCIYFPSSKMDYWGLPPLEATHNTFSYYKPHFLNKNFFLWKAFK